MRFWRWITFSLLCVAQTSCQKTNSTEQPNTLHLVIGAARIANPKERDAALAEACRESANQGVSQAVLMGVPQINERTLRDAVAEECATTLDAAGQNEAAVEIAKLITDQTKREEMLATLGEDSK
jgi:hypothetical protein